MLQVSTDDLRQAAQGLQTVADSFGQAWSAFSSATAAMGDIFGDDDVGGLIGMTYEAAHQIVEETFTSAVESLSEFAEGLTGMAAAHEANEEAVGALFTELSW